MSVLPSRARSIFRDLPWADAGHAAIVSAAPAIAAVLLGEPRLGWSAIAAFWSCFADPGGPLPRRLQAMGWVAVIGALYCFLGSSAQHILWLLLPLTFVCCALASFAQVWGPAAAIIGTLVSAGFVVSTELPTPTLAASTAYAGFFIGGGVWSIVMTALVWRRKPWRHATAAVAQCYIEIADYAGALGLLYLPSRHRNAEGGHEGQAGKVGHGEHGGHDGSSDAAWPRGDGRQAADTIHVGTADAARAGGPGGTVGTTTRWASVSGVHRKALRAQIETAKQRVREVLGSRPSRRDRGQQLLALIDAAEQAFVVLVALADTMASVTSVTSVTSFAHDTRHASDTAERAASAAGMTSVHASVDASMDAPPRIAAQRLRDAALLRVLHRFAQACHVIATVSDVDDAAQKRAMQNALSRTDQAVRQAHAAAHGGDVTLPTLLPLLDRLFGAGADAVSALLTHATEAFDHPIAISPDHTPSPTTPAWRIGLRQLRGNLHSRSSISRHAIRVGVAATTSVALCNLLNINHGYWMSLTVVFILQPYLASTWQRTTERILGSVAGAVGASLVGALLPSPLAVALAVLPIALGTFVGRTIHYAIFTFFLTLQFVLVAEIQQPAVHEFTLAGLRAMNSVYGGILALVIGMLLWPERSSQRLASLLAEAVDKHASYVRAVLQSALTLSATPVRTPPSMTAQTRSTPNEKADETDSMGTDSAMGSAMDNPMDSIKDKAKPVSLTALRRDACLAADNAQLVLQSLMRSPLHRQHGADKIAELIASLRGLTAAATVLELQPLTSQDNTDMSGRFASGETNQGTDAEPVTASRNDQQGHYADDVSERALADYVKRIGLALTATADRIRNDHRPADLPGNRPVNKMTTTSAANDAAMGVMGAAAATEADGVLAMPIDPPEALMRPADPRSLALQRISKLAQAVHRY